MGDPQRGRPRRAETDARILAAARELLRDRGPAGVHIDAVAERSGVARTTIYRRHRDRRELLAATLDSVTDQGRPSAEGTVRDKLVWMLERVREVLDVGIGRGGVAAVLVDADPDFTQALRTSLAARLDSVMDAMAEDAEAELLHRHVDPDALVNVAFGAYLGELLRYGEERDDWLERTTALLERAVRPAGVRER